MAVSNVSAVASVLAEIFAVGVPPLGGHRARDLLHIAHLSGPAVLAVALEGGADLGTPGAILAGVGILVAPVDQSLTVVASSSTGTVAGVIATLVNTGSAILAGGLLALVDLVLAVGARVSLGTNTGVRVDSVNATSSVHAAADGAVFIVDLTVGATES